MSRDVGAFNNYQTCKEGQVIYLGDNNTHKIHGQLGDVSIILTNGIIKKILNVSHIPCLKKNSFLTKQFDRASVEINLKHDGKCVLNNRIGEPYYYKFKKLSLSLWV
jgi:hypothetical protein